LSTTETESPTETKGVRQEIEDLKKAVEVQAATQAGANATQVATHAGTWSTMIAGAAGLVVGMFLGVAIMAVRS
jgi:cell division protein FtsX